MPGSKIRILSLLDAYSQVHEQAQIGQSSCLWQLTKARRSISRGGALVDGVLQGGDIREELYARKTLKDKCDEPHLEDEEGAETKLLSSGSPETGHFQLVDTLEEQLQQSRGFDKKDVNNTQNENDTMGLRRRKGKGEEGETTNAGWTVIYGEELAEEQRLRYTNPIDFFAGLPPRELKQAQQEAEKMLNMYVEAANLIFSIQEALEDNK